MRSTRIKEPTGSRRWRRGCEVEAILEAYQKSGRTQRVFAREIGIGVSTLQWWLRRARERARPKRRETSAAAPVGPLLEVELA